MNRFSTYSKYKDSGVEWLGTIPDHWKMVRIKNLLEESKAKSIDGHERSLSLSKTAGIIPFEDKENRTMQSASLVGAKVVNEGDVVFNRFKARLFAVSTYDGVVSPDYAVYKTKGRANLDYLVALFSTQHYRAAFDRKASGIGDGFSRLYTADLFSMYAMLPPKEEQDKMMSWLNKQTALIESLKSQKERELQTLNELKQAEIASVVTRGLNPNVPKKDSGIPWIGLIPAHWDTMRIRGLFKESEEKTTDESGTLLSLSQYTGITLKSEAGKTGMFEAESTVGYKVVHPGQFVMNIMLAWNGSYAVSDLEGIISPAYCVFDFRIDCNKKYYDYLLRTKAYSGAFKTQSRGIIDSRLRLYPYKFYAFRTLVPPIEEQNAIVDYIESKTTKIDNMIESLKAEIERLSEYKQRLISDVVTGQINVQDEII